MDHIGCHQLLRVLTAKCRGEKCYPTLARGGTGPRRGRGSHRRLLPRPVVRGGGGARPGPVLQPHQRHQQSAVRSNGRGGRSRVCLIGYVDHTGCHQLNRVLIRGGKGGAALGGNGSAPGAGPVPFHSLHSNSPPPHLAHMQIYFYAHTPAKREGSFNFFAHVFECITLCPREQFFHYDPATFFSNATSGGVRR
jgi:hypothetical protein